jgi:hypothetical protein
VNVAFTEGHGNVHLFTTNKTMSDWGTVRIAADLPTDGFGPGAAGNLGVLVHSSVLYHLVPN